MKNRMFKTLINSLVLGAVLTIGYIAGSALPTQAKASDNYCKLEWTELGRVEHTNEPAGLSQAEIDAVNRAKTSTDMGKSVPYGTYSKLMRVVACQYGDNYTACVTFVDCMGFEYHLDLNDSDISPGEYYTCTLSNNGTEFIVDDIVLKIKYERVDLLMDATSYLD